MPDPVVPETPPIVPETPPVVPPTKAWYDGADDVLIGHLRNRGLDTKTPAEAALELAKAHREAEGFIGVPANRIIKLPADVNDADAWKAVRVQLGQPADAKDYDFSGLKNGADADLDEDFVTFSRGLADKLGLSKDAARVLVKELVTLGDGVASESQATAQAALDADRAALKTNWGANHDANQILAANTAKKLFGEEKGPAIIGALEKAAGYGAVMEALRMIGSKIGEDVFVQPLSRDAPNVFTREQAVAEKDSLMRDADFVKAFNSKGMASDEYKRMAALDAIITGQK